MIWQHFSIQARSFGRRQITVKAFAARRKPLQAKASGTFTHTGGDAAFLC